MGAMVSAVGATPTVAVTDREGRFTFETLSPGPYFVRVHLSGCIAPRAQMVEVRSSTRTSSTISCAAPDRTRFSKQVSFRANRRRAPPSSPRLPRPTRPRIVPTMKARCRGGSDISAGAS